MSRNSTPNPSAASSHTFPDSVISPDLSHQLPARPDSSVPNLSQDILANISQSQTQPKFRGGFEVDDDEDDGYDEAEDDADVYDPEVSFVIDSNTAGLNDEEQIDRSSQSPEQDNGITPAAIQAVDTPADISSVVPDPIPELRTSSATPAQVVSTAQAYLPSADLPIPTTSILPKSRLAHDVIGILEDRIKDDPRGDITAWLQLIEEFKSRNKTEDVRQTYTRYFEVFPVAAEQWCGYVRWEESNDQRMKMEQIFNTALLKVPDVEFWSIYINYIRRRNSMQSGNVAASYKIINSAFSFCLEKVGIDKDAGRLWQDYIDFLKAGPGTIGGVSWEDKQKVDTLREAYQKALCVPTSALLSLWKEYDAFETGLSKINGRKYLQERSPAYMTARTAYTQLQNLTRDLDRTSRPRLPPAAGYQGDTEYAQQVALWKQWIQWEKDDNLVLKDDDVDQYHKRILFTYRQSLMALQFWPEMWYDAADFCYSAGLKDEGMALLNDGFKSNTESPLLAFKLADRIESTTSNDEGADPGAKARMKQVREPYDQVLDALYVVEKKTEARMQSEVQKVENAANNTSNGDSNGDDDLNASNVGMRKAATDAQIDAIKTSAQAHLTMLSKIITHVWIALMRATRRIQGKGRPGEKGAGFRMIFNEARKRGKLTSDFYVESALIEWICYRDETGMKIFERGVKLFPEDAYIPLEHIKHLIRKGDEMNARAVFETTISRFLAANNPVLTAKTKPLFAFFHDHESKYGELSQIERIESRMQQLFPEDPALKQFSERYSTTSFDPISVHPIISLSQLQPKSFLQPSIEISDSINSPIQKVIDSVAINSPKRPLDDADDLQPRKLIRAESPLKGAAGRRMNQQQRLSNNNVPQFPIPPPLPPQILFLLSILPKASTYVDTRFDPNKIVELIRDIHLPPPGGIGAPRPPQPPQQTSTPSWPPQYPPLPQPPMIPQGYMPPNASQPPYGAAPYRYT